MKAQLSAAIAGAYSQQLDSVAQQLWFAHGSGLIDDDDAMALAEAIEARRQRSNSVPRASAQPRSQRSPDRQRSIMRRRGLAACGAMPGNIAVNFTTSEQAVLVIIAHEVQRLGLCDLCMDALAAKAGTSRTTARNAIRTAETLGLIKRTERRIARDRNDTNILHIISPEWLTWLRLAPLGGRMQRSDKREYQHTNTIRVRPVNAAGAARSDDGDHKRSLGRGISEPAETDSYKQYCVPM